MPEPGKIGRYEVVERIGRGAMGALYRGRDPVLDREVAVKVMAADLSDDEDARARFFKEARAAARLQHRNIVTIYEFGDSEGNPYIAMELLRGESLASRMRAGPSLKVEETLDVGVQLCTGLHHAHACGVIHRDVKPANVWLQPDGTVKLLDFGIARVAASFSTRGKEGLGSVPYMAPERFGSGPVDSRVDVFAVGVILYELLAGRRPFEGESPTVIANKILHEDPPPLRKLVPGLPAGLLSAVARALQKDPETRFATAGDLGAELRSVALDWATPPAGRVRLFDPERTAPGASASSGVEESGSTASVAPEPSQERASAALGWRKVTVGLVLIAVAVAASLWVAKAQSWLPFRDDGRESVDPIRRPPVSAPVTMRVLVESVPDGAAIELNGTGLGKVTPAELEVSRENPGRLKLTKQGYVAAEAEITAEHLEAGKVSLPMAQRTLETVSISASGPYAFEITDGSRVISSANETHAGISVKGRQTVYLRAAGTLLNRAYLVDPAVQRQYTLRVPESGYLLLTVAPTLERCRAFVDRKDIGVFPDNQRVELAPGTYTVRLEDCAEGRGRQGRAIIQSGESFELRILAR